MQTNLKLLTRDGALFVAFTPVLTAPQYAALLELATTAVTREQLRQTLEAWAIEQGVSVSFDEP